MIATAALALTAAATSPGEPPPYPPATVLILVAPWCAPCHAELARLDELAAAARPLTVRVMTTADTPAARAMVRPLRAERRWSPDPALLARARLDLLARTPGLPYSVAVGNDGRVCANHGGGLDAAAARALVRRCDRR